MEGGAAVAFDDHRAVGLLLDVGAEEAEAVDGGLGVLGREEAIDAGATTGEGVEDEGAVGDGLVAGDGNFTSEAGSGADAVGGGVGGRGGRYLGAGY